MFRCTFVFSINHTWYMRGVFFFIWSSKELRACHNYLTHCPFCVPNTKLSNATMREKISTKALHKDTTRKWHAFKSIANSIQCVSTTAVVACKHHKSLWHPITSFPASATLRCCCCCCCCNKKQSKQELKEHISKCALFNFTIMINGKFRFSVLNPHITIC